MGGAGRSTVARLEVDARHPHDTVEPVFCHSIPVLFYQELLDSLNIIGVIDLCPGEGTCALACIKRMVPFVGVTFTEQHTARLMSHLEKTVLACVVTQGDPLYDVKLAEAVGTPVASPPESALATPARRPTSAAHGTPAAKRARLSPKPEPADADDDPVASEPAMSGDDIDNE